MYFLARLTYPQMRVFKVPSNRNLSVYSGFFVTLDFSKFTELTSPRHFNSKQSAELCELTVTELQNYFSHSSVCSMFLSMSAHLSTPQNEILSLFLHCFRRQNEKQYIKTRYYCCWHSLVVFIQTLTSAGLWLSKSLKTKAM